MKIMVVGSNGALGSELLLQLKKQNNFEVIPVTRKNMDLCGSFQDIEKFIKTKSPHLIINCAAFLGIENCYKNTNDALLINTFFPNKLYCISKQLGIKVIQISTECVFSCDNENISNNENTNTNPQTTYGVTKNLGECVPNKNFIVIRLPLLFGPTNKNQIVKKLIENVKNNKIISVSNDVITTPVYTPFVANWIINNVIQNEKSPILIHLCSDKYLSMYEFMTLILKKKNLENLIKSVSSDIFPASEPKPKNGGLSSIYHDGFSIELMVNEYLKVI